MSESIRGPKAPKDPDRVRASFYIMRGKEIMSMPDNNGKGISYIYENDGRMISASILVGGITDENMHELMRSVEGFRKLVHSIGVRVESDNPSENVRFVFQMYGSKDIYGGGSNIVCDMKANGMENIIVLDELDWSEDDDEPGQIRYEFDKAAISASVSVRLFLNDGYEAPEIEEEYPVDICSHEYEEMIARSLVQSGNNYRLKQAIEKARSGQDTTIAFIGGSITQGAGAVPINSECYARKVFDGLCQITGRSREDNIRYVKAGVGGTPSELGLLRYQKDILDEAIPDIVIVEFAVNDEGDETKGECYDSLVRKIYNGPGSPAVILLFSVFADDFNLQDRLFPVGYAYELPMVSVKNALVEQFYKRQGDGRVISKNQYFYDRFHPSNIGHTVMADSVLYMMRLADETGIDDKPTDILNIKAPIGADFENVIRFDRKLLYSDIVPQCGSFTERDEELQCVERNMDLFTSAQFADNWMKPYGVSAENRPFTFDICCRILMLVFKDSAENRVGKARVLVDGNQTAILDPREVGWTHCNAAIVYRAVNSGMHHIEISMLEGDENKEFTILGFGVVE